MSALPELKPEHAWLGHVQPVGLVVSTLVLDELGLLPETLGPIETAQVGELIVEEGPALPDVWAFLSTILGWRTPETAGASAGPAIPDDLRFPMRDHDTLLEPTMAVRAPGGNGWQLLVRVEAAGIDLDRRGELTGWEATPHQRFERLLRETGVGTGLLIADDEIRLITAPRGETSGWIIWPIRPLATVAGRPMLGGLRLLLDSAALFTNPAERRLPALLKASRERQAEVSTKLAGQVLAALHELLRGFDAAEPVLIRELADARPQHVYEGLLAVLMRLVFILYAEDRDLMPSRTDDGGRELYEQGYSLRGLFAQLDADAALNPDTMDDRRGAWGRLLALFRLVNAGHRSGFMQARRGKLFDEGAFPFLMGKHEATEPDRVPPVSDGCIHRVLRSLMMVDGERLSYRTLDVEQIGSVYETVMGFTVERTQGRSIAIAAGKNNRTPVFVNLDALLPKSAADRLKAIKEDTGRGQLGTRVTPLVRNATDVAALEAALGGIADLRGSPRSQGVPAGTPILQPTDERRRTGSHYTPRSLTEPIVRHALEPAFARLTEDATPEEVLALKVCDPACGSGAFLVEATRQIGTRLAQAWERHGKLKPPIPADEDEDLHARRLVAQRCIYGVDRNPMAVDLAKLSLWLATLARDHEFSFLDHALKCGDSLVGLSRQQLTAGSWEKDARRQTLLGQQIGDRVAKVLTQREAIRTAADDVSLAIQETRHGEAERELARVRVIGDAIIAAFFKHDKPRQRIEEARYIATMSGGASDWWEALAQRAVSLAGGAHPVRPFHWEIEFPEVFARDNPGFDAIAGNPPFAGKNTIIAGSAKNYLPWLQTLHEGAHGNADLVAHFFLRAFGLLRSGGMFGLIATNTIGQGDTRASGLTKIIAEGGEISRATRRLKWPGEAAVVVSVVHIVKGAAASPLLDHKAVRRISAYLVEGDLDTSPAALATNSGKAYVGSYVLGMGFTFDDVAAQKGEAESLGAMRRLTSHYNRNAERIFPYIGGDEVNTSPTHAHHRFIIDFENMPLQRDPSLPTWVGSSSNERINFLRTGVVPPDYPDSVANDWPDLVSVLRNRVQGQRADNNRPRYVNFWWQYAERRPGLYAKLIGSDRVLVRSLTSANFESFTFLPPRFVYDQTLIVWPESNYEVFATLCSRAHYLWGSSLGADFGGTGRYNIIDCFQNYPMPRQRFEETGRVAMAYHAFRAQLMISRNEGLTKTYNCFHARDEKAADIARLRELHHEMDVAVLRAYGWDDLADRAAPEFIEQEADEGKTPKTRLDWPSEFKDEVLARLLALNATRAAEERAAGLVAADEADDDETEDGEGE